ncbi:UNVERIFIED_CONTAM: hypothetical protein RMT77_018570 [Armadillidium vulgare]
MVSRLEDLCGIQEAIELANKLEFKKEKVFYVNRSMWKDGCEPFFEKMKKKALDALEKLPFVLREKIPIPVVIFCLSQSMEWVKFHNLEFDLSLIYSCSFLRSSFFTSKGILNKEKAARELLKDTELSPSLKFCIACHYCLSDVIPGLWEQLPEDKRPILKNKVFENGFCIGERNKMADLWSYFLLGELEILMEEEDDSFSLYKFKKTLEYNVLHRGCNDVAFKKCFEELNELQKEEALIFTREKLLENFVSDFYTFGYSESDASPDLFSLQSFLPFQDYLEIAIFFFRHLDQRQLMVFFQPVMLYYVLFHLLSWPYEHMFMDVVSQFWEVLPKSGFCLLLHRIVSLIKNKSSSKLCDYHNILRDFWIQSPSFLKRFFFCLEGMNKSAMFRAITYEERDNNSISALLSHFKNLDSSYLICKLFDSPFIFEDENGIQLIFGSATLEEKSDIVRLQGNRIGKISFEAGDLRRIDLFIECCVPKGGIESFKIQLFNDENVKRALFFLLVFDNKGKEFQKILNWAFSAEEIKEWLKNFLVYVRQEWKYILYSWKNIKCFNESLEWVLSSNEIENFKKSLASDVGSIAWTFEDSISEGDFQDIENFLELIFSSEMEMVKFKKDFAFEMVRHMDQSFLGNDLSSLKKLIEWSAPSEEEGKDFRRQLAFSEKVIKYYSKLVAKRQLNEVDAFIRWTELTEMEVKNFIKLVDKNNILIVRPKTKLESSLQINSTKRKRRRNC